MPFWHTGGLRVRRRSWQRRCIARKRMSPTIYTAVYRPAELRVDYLWPGKRWTQRVAHFEPGEYTHDYGELIA
jgi:hypothetical protein